MEQPKATPFKRTDITTVASTNRGCIRLLPQGKKATKQKLVVGDMNGVLSSFSVGKSLDIKSEFANDPCPKAISRLTLHEDQIFVANGASVSAHTRKGKQFFVLETTMSEEIRLLSVRSPFLYIGGGYMITAFQESTEKGFFMCPDKMNDSALDPMNVDPESSAAAVFLGCQDRVVRRVHHGKVTSEASCEAPVSAISFESGPKLPKGQKYRNVHYGTLAGTVSCVQKNSEVSLVGQWNHMPTERSASVSAVMSCNLSQSGVPDVAVAREDGTVQVFQKKEEETENKDNDDDNNNNDNNSNNTPLNSILTSSMGEFVSGLDCGYVMYGDHEDVVVSTFSGKVVSLATPMASDFVVPQTAGSGGSTNNNNNANTVNPASMNDDAHTLPQANQMKIQEVKSQINDLQEKLHDSKVALSRIQAMHSSRKPAQHADENDAKNKDHSATGGRSSITSISKVDGAMANFGVVDRFSLDEQSGDLVITTELDVALGTVCVSSAVPLDIVDEQSDACSSWDPAIVTNKNDDIVSANSVAAGASNQISNKQRFLGVFRCGSADASGMPKRLEIRFRCSEGDFGVLTTTIHTLDRAHGAIPRTYNIPPLSRHVRLAPSEVPKGGSNGDEPLSASPQFGRLFVSGPFSIQEAHRWIHTCLMEVPERVSDNNQEQQSVTYHFRNMYINSILEITISKGQIAAFSQNAMTLTILRDQVSRQATARKIAVKIDSSMRPEAVDAIIWLGIEIWRGLRSSAEQYELIDALKELESQEGEEAAGKFLSPYLKSVLSRQKQLQADSKHHEKNLAELKDFLKRWLADAIVFCNASSSASQIESVLVNFSRLLEMPATEQSETELRMFVRDVCFPSTSSNNNDNGASDENNNNNQQNVDNNFDDEAAPEQGGDRETMIFNNNK